MLTVNIDDDSLKIALFRGNRAVIAVEEPLIKGIVQNGLITDRKAVSQVITRTLTEHGIREKSVVASVSAVHSIYRVVSVPRLDKKLLTEVATREMERVSPVPVETLYISWQEVNISGSENALCFVGLPHENVDSVIDTLRMSGLDVSMMELKPLAVARVIDERTAVAVNIRTDNFDLAVVDNTIPQLVRSLSFPDGVVTEPDRIGIIKEELLRTINFYNSSRTGSQLTGQTCCFISGISGDNLSIDVGMRVKPLPKPVLYPGGIDHTRFTVNTGMALGEKAGARRWMRIKINVLPRQDRIQPAARISKAPIVAVFISGAIIIAALAAFSNYAAGESAKLRGLVDEKTRQVMNLQKTMREDRDKIIKQRDDYSATLRQLKAPLDESSFNKTRINRDIGRVIADLPGVMYLTLIEDNGNAVNLEGLSPDAEMVIDYALKLRSTGLFKMVNISSIKIENYNDVRFGMVLIKGD